MRQVYDGSQCERGYTGFLCSSCAQYANERYEKGSGNSCILCEEKDDALSRFLFFLFILAILLVCFYFIGEARKPQAVKNKFSIGTKTFLNHLQVLSFMGDLQSQWSGLIRSMFNISNLSNLGFNIGNVGCSVQVTFQSKLIVYCMSPFLISLVPMIIYVVESLFCYRKLVLDTRRRLKLVKNNQDYAALLNIDKGPDLDYIQSRYALEEAELLHLSLTWKDHLRDFKKTLVERKDLTSEEAVNMRYNLGKDLLKKQVWTDSVVVLMVVTFLLFSTISRQIFYTFSVRLYPALILPVNSMLCRASHTKLGTSHTFHTPTYRSTAFQSWSRSRTSS
jgi:heme exporter protein D